MERLNSEGLARNQLLFALKSRPVVAQARRLDSCLLCRNKKVNEAGLCDICFSFLDGEEQKLAERWLAGVGP